MPLDRIVSTDETILSFAENFRSYEIAYIEESSKVVDNSINSSRLNIKLYSENIDLDDVLKILSKYNFPEKYVETIKVWFKWSIFTMFSLDKETMVYRIYFEKPINGNCVREQRHGTICSIKWDYFDPDKSIITNYYTILTKNIDFVVEEAKQCGVNSIPNFIIEYFKKLPLISFYIAQDTNSKRKSISIPFLNNTIYLKDIASDNLNIELKKYQDKCLKHIQFGIDKDNKKFYTFYFSIYRADPKNE